MVPVLSSEALEAQTGETGVYSGDGLDCVNTERSEVRLSLNSWVTTVRPIDWTVLLTIYWFTTCDAHNVFVLLFTQNLYLCLYYFWSNKLIHR